MVLGSAGQVGSALCEHLKSRGYGVSGFDIQDSIDQDLRTWPNALLRHLVQDADFIFFLAFDVGGSHYLEKYQDSFDFANNNLRIMSNTFSLLQEMQKPFVFASSQMANMSYSTYGLLKTIGEKITASLQGRTVHFWNVYGFESEETKFHVISDFILQASSNGIINMRTTGEESRDFLHVKDCSDALEIVMNSYFDFPESMPLHICRNEFTSILEIAEIIAGKFNAKVNPGTKMDLVQKDAKNNPNLEFRKYWDPKIDLVAGIEEVISHWDI